MEWFLWAFAAFIILLAFTTGGKAKMLASRGFVVVRGCDKDTKAQAWQALLPKLMKAWQRVLPSFDLRKRDTWPIVARAHAFTYKEGGYPVRIWSDHAEALSVARNFCGCDVEGEENSWCIVNFPSNRVGPTPSHAHVDDGRDGSFRSRGPSDGYDLLDRQAALALYCCTPGDLTPRRGSTMLYPGSHLLILGLLRRRKFDWVAMQKALKDGVLDELATQITIRENEMALLAGPLVHGTAYCDIPMSDDMPRVIMNPKLFPKRRVGSFAMCIVENPRLYWEQGTADVFDRLLDALDRATLKYEQLQQGQNEVGEG